jgi:hypothetical protein
MATKPKVDKVVKSALEKAAVESLSSIKNKKMPNKIIKAGEVSTNLNKHNPVVADEELSDETVVDDSVGSNDILSFDFTDDETNAIDTKKAEVSNEVIEEVLENETASGPTTYNFLGIDVTVDKNPEGSNYILTLSNDGVSDTREISGNSFQEIMEAVEDYLVTFEVAEDNVDIVKDSTLDNESGISIGEDDEEVSLDTDVEDTETLEGASLGGEDETATEDAPITPETNTSLDAPQNVPPAQDTPVQPNAESSDPQSSNAQTVSIDLTLNLTGNETTPDEIANAITVDVHPDVAEDNTEGYYAAPEEENSPVENTEDLDVSAGEPETPENNPEVENDELLGGVYGIKSGTCYFKGSFKKCKIVAGKLNKKAKLKVDPIKAEWSHMFKKNKNSLMAYAKLGYGFKKFILESNKGELFKNNIKEYVEKNKKLDEEILLAKNLIEKKDKPKYILAKKMNKELTHKYKTLNTTIDKVHSVLVEGKCDKEHAATILASMMKVLDVSVDKYDVILAKTTNLLDKISLNSKKQLNNKAIISNKVNDPKTILANNRSNRRNNSLIIDDRSSTRTIRHDGTDEILEEILNI